jgi:hypothetical protein
LRSNRKKSRVQRRVWWLIRSFFPLPEILILIYLVMQTPTMKLILSLFVACISITCFSQRPGKRVESKEVKVVTTAKEMDPAAETNSTKPAIEKTDSVKTKAHKENQAYSELRRRLTRPPDGIKKVLAMIDKIKDDPDNNAVLSMSDYNSLSLREKFTYNVIHAESYSQNCQTMPLIKGEDTKIFAYLPEAYGEFAWSERQTKFFSANRDSVIKFMRESMGRTKRAGINFKQVMLEINAREMIPDIIATYRANKKVQDLDMLTVLMNLMKDNEYEPFLISGSYKKLYAPETSYKSYLKYSQSNEDLIIKRAMAFYNAEKKK